MPAPPTSTSPADTTFDAIVVGSGAGGAPLAARLAEAGWRVLVIEAGPDNSALPPTEGAHEVSEVPVLHGPSTEYKDISWEFFVKHYDHPQQADCKWHTSNNPLKEGIFYPRATGVGGCTIHNALLTIAGPDSDWDELAWFLNDPSWRADVMRTYFQRLEHCEFLPPPEPLPRSFWGRFWENVRWLFGKEIDPTGGRHGFDGWLSTSVADFSIGLKDPQLLAMLLAAAETSALAGLEAPKSFIKAALKGKFVEELDPNHARRQAKKPEGLALIPTAIYSPNARDKSRRGHRSSPRDLLRDTQARLPNNLFMATNCLVTKILLEPAADGALRATGVEYRHGERLYRALQMPSNEDGKVGRIHAKREVILAGGAFNTPQVLMLSGIGPRDHLQQMGIPCVVDSPGVGQNLQDRYEVTLVSKMTSDFALLRGATLQPPANPNMPDEHLAQWRKDGSGLYATNGTVLGILKRSRPELAQPDLFIFGLPLKFLGYSVGYSKVRERDLFTWAILKAHTRNRNGRVRLRSADPRDPPEINFHYFQEGSPSAPAEDPDLQAILHGVKFVREIASRADCVVEEFKPGKGIATDDELKAWIKQVAWGHHACGTCRMGRPNDPEAVLDSEFRVLAGGTAAGSRQSIAGLRVVDASIFWKIPGYFIVTNIYMASEKAADTILASWKS